MNLKRHEKHHHRWAALLYHDVTETESSLTAGLGVSVAPEVFFSQLEYCRDRYGFVSPETALTAEGPRAGGHLPLLLTFDDAYASVARLAAPICNELGIKAVFFVNAGLLDNQTLALDNLVAHVVNTKGSGPLVSAAGRQLRGIDETLRRYVPQLSLAERYRFFTRLAEAGGVNPVAIAQREQPYLSSHELAQLPAQGFEIGNHTTSHVHCRILDTAEAIQEVVGNKRRLEEVAGVGVRAFAFPYGHKADATPTTLDAIRDSGHESAFLVHYRHNAPTTNPMLRYRITLRQRSPIGLVKELEILPRLRALKDTVRRMRK